ncbi:MAG: hypothetical protein KJ950_12335 [Proteobacteria bacterium]|nr:hypothetical protein [Pseudomonadota bacterium]MBU1687607.1 hypothetical protein [Pseudomonadota bacterium]
MSYRAETFFSPEEKQMISDAVHQVEQRTSGEVAVMVVDESDSYPESRLLAGLIIGTTLSLAITEALAPDSLWIFLAGSIGLGILFGFLTEGVPPLKRFFIPTPRLEALVRTRAEKAFYDQGLYKTRDETGVLFFLSLFERKIWVLADRGIYEKIDRDELQGFASRIGRGIRQGHAAQTIVEMIGEAGSLLALHFPIKNDDTNELSNEVIIG